MHHYRLFGLEIQSDIRLPADPSVGGRADVVVRIGRTPARLASPADNWHGFEVAPGEMLMNIDRVGRWRVCGGREIVVEPDERASLERLQAYLLGSAFGALLHQRGLFALHASSILCGEKAMMFAGASGRGKSTIVAALHQRGYPVMADDLTAIQVPDDGPPTLFPGRRRLKLSPDAAACLRFGASGTATADGEIAIDVPEASSGSASVAARIYVLSGRHTTAGPLITRLSGTARILQLRRHTFRARLLNGLGAAANHRRQCVSLARSVEMFRIRRLEGLAALPALIDEIERHMAGPRDERLDPSAPPRGTHDLEAEA